MAQTGDCLPWVERSGAGQPVASLLDPVEMVRNLWRHRYVTLNLASRDIAGRYRTSLLGMFWAVLTPLLLLTIYTFVFSVVLKSRWGQRSDESTGAFAVTMFCGMLVFNLFSEVMTRAPTLIIYNPNLVKKVVFPLEVFVPAALLTALFNFLVGMSVWILGWLWVMRAPPSPSIVWLAVVLLPVCLSALGLGWFLASLGTFVRDIGHMIVLIMQVLFFATPVFYRVDVVPEPFRRFMYLNPLTTAVEDARRVMMGHRYWEILGISGGSTTPAWNPWVISVLASAVVALLGYAFFIKSKRAFGDVI